MLHLVHEIAGHLDDQRDYGSGRASVDQRCRHGVDQGFDEHVLRWADVLVVRVDALRGLWALTGREHSLGWDRKDASASESALGGGVDVLRQHVDLTEDGEHATGRGVRLPVSPRVSAPHLDDDAVWVDGSPG